MERTKPTPYQQAVCNYCEEPIGFVGQQIAYSAEEGGWECPKHIDQMWKRKVDRASAQGRVV